MQIKFNRINLINQLNRINLLHLLQLNQLSRPSYQVDQCSQNQNQSNHSNQSNELYQSSFGRLQNFLGKKEIENIRWKTPKMGEVKINCGISGGFASH